MKLAELIQMYFDEYLTRIKGARTNTIKSYRDAFTLFLKFASKHYSSPVKNLMIAQITPLLIFSFLDYLEGERKNTQRTRNSRLAALKSLAKMIKLLVPEQTPIANMILNIPQKQMTKNIIGYLTHDEMIKVFESVDLIRKEGFRDYTILNLLYDSGARASEIARLNLDYFRPENEQLAIWGKGDRYRIIELWPKTVELIELYIAKYRVNPKPPYQQRLFINQRREEFSRYGIYYICKKYLMRTLSTKQMRNLNPVHSFRHSCAVNLLLSGASITDIRNHLGHEKLSSTMIYLHLNMRRRKETQKKFIEYTQSKLKQDSRIDELIDWENKTDTLNWLDSL